MAVFIAQLQVVLYLAQLQALLGHHSSRASTSTSKSADPHSSTSRQNA